MTILRNAVQNKVQDIYANVTKYHEPATREIELYSQLTSCGVSIDRSSIQYVCSYLCEVNNYSRGACFSEY